MRSILFLVLALLVGGRQSTWEDSSFAVATLDHVVVASACASLSFDLTKLAFHSKAPRCSIIDDFAILNDRLFASTNYDGKGFREHGQILEFDPFENAWKAIQDFDWSGALNLRVSGGKMYQTEFPMTGSAAVHVFDGTAWTTLARPPGNILHGLDVCEWKKKLYWSGSVRGDNFKDPKAAAGFGRVCESADGGKTWKIVYTDTENGRIGDMAVFKDHLYANRRGINLLRYDGSSWKDIFVDTPLKTTLGDARFTVFKDQLLMVNPSLFYRYDGSKWVADKPGFYDLFTDGATCWGIREGGDVWSTTDGKDWKQVSDDAIVKGEFGASAGTARPIRQGSVVSYRGRLFVGTMSEGKIYASPFVEAGSLISAVKKSAGGSSLAWNAKVAKGAGLAVSVRTGATEDECKAAKWIELGASPAKVENVKAFLQYRLAFTSDGAAAAVVRSVSWLK